MEKIVRSCDRCHAEIAGEVFLRATLNLPHLRQVDLCGECEAVFLGWMNVLKVPLVVLDRAAIAALPSS